VNGVHFVVGVEGLLWPVEGLLRQLPIHAVGVGIRRRLQVARQARKQYFLTSRYAGIFQEDFSLPDEVKETL